MESKVLNCRMLINFLNEQNLARQKIHNNFDFALKVLESFLFNQNYQIEEFTQFQQF